jgi:hypothetical protein
MASRKMAGRWVWIRKEVALDMVTRKLSLCVLRTRKSCTIRLQPSEKYPVEVASLGYFSSKSTKPNLLSKRDTAPIISSSSPASSCLLRRGGAGARVGGTGTAGISLASSGSPAVVASLRKKKDGEFPVQLEEESTHTIGQDLLYLKLLWRASLVRSERACFAGAG